MRTPLIPALFAGVLAAGAAFCPAPAAAQPQGYFGPGRDDDYQPPAYDRDRVGLDGAARFLGGGGLYGGPLYDREPYGYGYSGAGAGNVRPDRSGMERAGSAQFERGYRLGREDERYRLRARAAHARALGDGFGPGAEPGAPGGAADGDRDVADLLIEHSRRQRAMRDVRQSLQEARTAIQENDRARAEAALAQADQKLRAAGPGVGGDRLAVGLLNQSEAALERGDQVAARRALREARQAVFGPEDAQQRQAQQQPRPANPAGGEGGSGGDGAGVRPQQGGGGSPQQGPAAGAGGQSPR